jgi:3-oxoacyl-[acyl-carrier-protein] synthase-3
MAVPETVLTNQELEGFLETSDEWIRSRTGIRERRIASEREFTASLGLRAAQRALDDANMQPTEIDLIIVATSTPENIFPSTACLIQNALGAAKAGAFDLSAACSGFVYGLELAAQAIRSGSIQAAVVIGAETMSRIVDWQDRNTAVLFGDGAGAVVLRASPVKGGVLSAVLRSDGSGADMLSAPTVGSQDLRSASSGLYSLLHEGQAPLENGSKIYKMSMNGGEVFKFATRVIGDSILQALDKAGLTLNDVKLIVPHQANARIIQAAARALKLEPEKFMSNLERYGNTSAASIPIALCEAADQKRIKENDYVVFVGFGGGLTWAAMVLQWGDVKAPERSAATFVAGQRRQITYLLARLRAPLRRLNRRLADFASRFRHDRS